MAVMMTTAMLMLAGWQALQSSARPVQMPVRDIVHIEGPEGWSAIGSFPHRPALSLYEHQRPVVVLTCQDTSIHVQIRGLAPAQAWPQPEMTLQFGQARRSATPDVRNIGDQVAYEMRFPIADQVLEPISQGLPMSVSFNGQTRTYPTLSEDLVPGFAAQCATLVPEGMRRARR